MELMPLIWKSLLWFTIFASITLIGSYVTFKIRKKRGGKTTIHPSADQAHMDLTHRPGKVKTGESKRKPTAEKEHHHHHHHTSDEEKRRAYEEKKRREKARRAEKEREKRKREERDKVRDKHRDDDRDRHESRKPGSSRSQPKKKRLPSRSSRIQILNKLTNDHNEEEFKAPKIRTSRSPSRFIHDKKIDDDFYDGYEEKEKDEFYRVKKKRKDDFD